MAETLLSFGVQKLLKLLVDESDRFEGVEEQFDKLKSDVDMLRSFLKGAYDKRHSSAMVRSILKEIKEVVLDAEDLVETFLLKEDPSIRESVSKIACTRLALDIEAISKRISKVICDMQSLGVQPAIVNGRQRRMRKKISSDNEDILVGLEKNVKKLVGYLVEEDSTSQVVSITGMGGLGKTTLARQVFNHETVKSHFTGLSWVSFSQHFTRKSVWQTILLQLMPECKVLEMSEEEIQEMLVLAVESQKALIVIDDIWREADWDQIKHVFLPIKGWKVLLTSRNEGVAVHADPNCITFKLECLTFEESWNFFQRIAFPNTTEIKVDDENKMEKMGKEMLQKCGGLPLAIKVLGGLLATQYSLREWKRLHDNVRSHIIGRTSFDENNINLVHHVLYLSFEDLPIYLKHCFLYLAQFPEDYAIDVAKLSYYWAAEGIRSPMSYVGVSIREEADGYIDELVKRNMVVSERDIRTSRYETCQLHVMMREVCLRQAEEEDFLQIVHDSSTSSSPSESRRLVIQSHGDTYLMQRLQNPKLRTILLRKQSPSLNWMAQDLLFTSLQLIRVLDLSESDFGGKLPSSIGELIHLRYLSLYKAHVTHLPPSMGNLKLLIYLNLCVAAGSPVYMSNFLKELRELRYLSFPWEIQDGAKLELGNLTNLEKLENFSTKHSHVSDLHGMIELTTLSILLNGQKCSIETLSSCLRKMQHLENLTISDHGDDKKKYFLRCIPSVQVEQAVPSHLTTISLRHCYLEEDPLPVLEKLLHLKEVYLGERSFSGKKMVCSGCGFPQLQKLTLKKLVQLEEWVVEEGSMPLLQTLSIRFCDKLKELSDGLRFIPIKELTIVVMEKPFKAKLSRGGEDYYKVKHIPALKLYGYLRK